MDALKNALMSSFADKRKDIIQKDLRKLLAANMLKAEKASKEAKMTEIFKSRPSFVASNSNMRASLVLNKLETSYSNTKNAPQQLPPVNFLRPKKKKPAKSQ